MSAYAPPFAEVTADSFSPEQGNIDWRRFGASSPKSKTPVPEAYHGIDEDSFFVVPAQTAATSAKELGRIYGEVIVETSNAVNRITSGFYEASATPISTFIEPFSKRAEAESEPPAYLAFKQSARRLQMKEEDLATLVGIGRTTPSSWVRERREPRPSTVRKLYELRATLSAVSEVLGEDGLMTWLDAGSPRPREAIMEGRWNELNDMIWNAVFAPTVKNQPDLSWVPEELEPVTEDARNAPTPKATRRKFR